MRIPELAKRLRVSDVTVRHLLQSGKLKSTNDIHKSLGYWNVSEEQLQEFLMENKD